MKNVDFTASLCNLGQFTRLVSTVCSAELIPLIWRLSGSCGTSIKPLAFRNSPGGWKWTKNFKNWGKRQSYFETYLRRILNPRGLYCLFSNLFTARIDKFIKVAAIRYLVSPVFFTFIAYTDLFSFEDCYKEKSEDLHCYIFVYFLSTRTPEVSFKCWSCKGLFNVGHNLEEILLICILHIKFF